jgi:LmbE family N-acetylglucosaminyl deacetylase
MVDTVDVMLIVPHPDDEVFGCGGLFTKMAAFNKPVATITLTRGGQGRTLQLCSREELPAVRERELRASLEVLGVAYPYIFDFPDGGLKEVPERELMDVLVPLIDEHKPRVVITFPPNGANGHPDHVTTHRVTLEALEASGHRVEALYYFAGERPIRLEPREGWLAPEEVHAGYLSPTHYLEVGAYLENKLRAMGQHETQARSVLHFMRRFPRRLVVEAFHRAYPPYPEDVGPMTMEWL